MHPFNKFLKACLIVSLCRVQFVSADFTTVNLSDRLSGATLAYEINLNNPNANGKDTITIMYTVPAESWCAIGVNPTGAGMVGGEVVILKPAEPSIRKYKIAAKDVTAITEMSAQTLIDASFLQESGTTTLMFTKIMDEADEFTITSGASNTFIASYGFSNDFAFHQGYGVTEVALEGPLLSPTVAPMDPSTAPVAAPIDFEPPSDTFAPNVLSAVPVSQPVNPPTKVPSSTSGIGRLSFCWLAFSIMVMGVAVL